MGSTKRWANSGALTIGLLIGIITFGLSAYVYFTDYDKDLDDKDISESILNNYKRSVVLYSMGGGAVVFLFALLALSGQSARNGSSISYVGFICFLLSIVIYLFVATPDPTSSSYESLYTTEIYERADSQIDKIGDQFDVDSDPTILKYNLFVPLAKDTQVTSESIMFTGFIGLGCIFMGLGLFGARGIAKLAGLFFLLGGVASLAAIQFNAKNVDWITSTAPDVTTSDYERYVQVNSAALGAIALASLMSIFALASKAQKEKDVDLTKEMKLPKKMKAPAAGIPPAVSVGKEEGVRFCPECGENLPKGAPYCPFCGFKL